ncbi:MAG: 2,3-bisphosphoglycerate-independent phosphoglycerate mutase [Coxiellaceae bacterium]|nr:2,3-bisphosphoglycerate-independent phosphoglycerate mutase [Coxiellaceae bacterium]
MNTQRPKPIVLMILDGWGYRPESQHNPCEQAETPFIDSLFQSYPHRLIEASGETVGLPAGQIGNSEVGHLHLGAGRLMRQDLSRINHAIDSGEFAQNKALCDAIATAKQSNNTVHILGLLSPGGVHSHQQHIMALIELLAEQGIEHSYLHAFLDGRDVPPQSALSSLELIQKLYTKVGNGQIASICGRYYAMDRDKRWPRTGQAYDLLTSGITTYNADSAVAGLEQAYARGENDEFVQPTTIQPDDKAPITVNDGDVVIFMNYRADRARQLSHALIDEHFTEFERKKTASLADFVTLTQYSKDIDSHVVFATPAITNGLGETLAKHHLSQLRLAETEKYAHVTYFFNGGVETPYEGEEHQLVASPKVATYDLQPEMSAAQVTDHLCEAINNQHYDVIICNYANPDMVGHTGIESAAQQAMETMDQCLQRVITSLQTVDGVALITADHGNIECIYDESTGQPHTAHTTNQVPLIYIGDDAHFDEQDGALYDVAPTVLALAGITPPQEMTGRILLHFEND